MMKKGEEGGISGIEWESNEHLDANIESCWKNRGGKKDPVGRSHRDICDLATEFVRFQSIRL